MSKVWQEFYCAKSGGGCGGYITVKLNMAVDGVHTVVCPKCGHRHQRGVKGGHIVVEGRFSPAEGHRIGDIMPTMAAYSTKPRTDYMKKHAGGNGNLERNAAVIEKPQGKPDGAVPFLRSLWFEHFGGKT